MDLLEEFEKKKKKNLGHRISTKVNILFNMAH